MSQSDGVEAENVQERRMESCRYGNTKMVHESIVNLTEF